MKKTLSVFLSVILTLSVVMSAPFIANARVTEYTEADEYLINTSGSAKNAWLEKDETLSASDSLIKHESTDGRATIYGGALATKPVIATYNTLNSQEINTDVEDFVWTFEFASINKATVLNNLTAFFMFHVNENSEYTTELTQYDGTEKSAGLGNAKNFIAVVYKGNSNVSTDGLQNKAFNVVQTTVLEDGSTVMRPLSYTTDDNGNIIADESSYLSYDNTDNSHFNNSTAKSNFARITIKLVDRCLTITLEPVDTTKWSSYSAPLTKNFMLSEEAIAAAPSGDFVVTMSSAAESTDAKGLYYKNMSVKEITVPDNGLIFDTTDIDSSFVTNGWEKANSWFTVTNNTADNAVRYNTTQNATVFSANSCMDPVLTTNGYTNTNLTDFVWEFEYRPHIVSKHNLTVLFHVDEDREVNKTVLPSDTSSPRGQIRNALGLTIYGTDYDETTDRVWPNSIRVDYANNSTYNGMPTYKYVYEGTDTETTEDDKSTNKPYAYVNYKSFNNSTETISNDMVADWYTVRVTLKGNMLVVNMWQNNYKAETMTTLYHEFSAEQMEACPSGDFAMLSGANGYIKNMKIYNGADAVLNTEDYSVYNDYVTEYSFDSDVADIVIEDEATGSVSHDDTEKALKIGTESGKTAIIRSFDGGNNNLGDFIAQYDWSENHQWTNASIHFRKQDDKNYYRIRFYKNTTTASQKNDRYYISLYKYVNGAETELAVAPMSKSITAGQKYSIVLKAIEDKIELYFAQQGTVIDTPIISVNDDTYATGEFWYTHYNGSAYIYDMKIYDLTAKAFADDVNDFNVDEIVRADRTEVKVLSEAYSLLHTAQQTKAGVIKAKATLDGNVATIAELEAIAMDVNVTEGVDVRDLVALKIRLSEQEGYEIKATADPEFDGVIDSLDMVALCKYLLGVAYY